MMCDNNCINYKLNCNKRVPKKNLNEVLLKELKEKDLPYYTPREVVVHNSSDDCWVSFLGIVRDLTPLVRQYGEAPETRPIVAFAGKDISDWFDPRTGDIKHHIHPVTGVRVPYLPHGLLPDVLPQVPSSEWGPLVLKPWWLDPSFVVGYVTKNARPIRIMNVLTGREWAIEVCSEDTLDRILERQLMFNTHATSYVWKYEGRVLDMELTLDQNKVPDPRPQLRAVHLPDDTFTPCLMLYYSDDLT